MVKACETQPPEAHPIMTKAAQQVVNGKANSKATQQLSLLQLWMLDLSRNNLTGPLPNLWSSLKLVSMLLHATAACAVGDWP